MLLVNSVHCSYECKEPAGAAAWQHTGRDFPALRSLTADISASGKETSEDIAQGPLPGTAGVVLKAGTGAPRGWSGEGGADRPRCPVPAPP